MIDVWFAHATVVREADLALLDADELAHLGSLRRSDERASYVAGHALLRRAVGAALGADPVSLDALQARTGLDTPTLQARLLELELDGLVGRLPGGLFQRLGQA